jgi:hypothetical protein
VGSLRGLEDNVIDLNQSDCHPARDQQVLNLLAPGRNNTEIAGQLTISRRPVKQPPCTLFFGSWVLARWNWPCTWPAKGPGVRAPGMPH